MRRTITAGHVIVAIALIIFLVVLVRSREIDTALWTGGTWLAILTISWGAAQTPQKFSPFVQYQIIEDWKKNQQNRP